MIQKIILRKSLLPCSSRRDKAAAESFCSSSDSRAAVVVSFTSAGSWRAALYMCLQEEGARMEGGEGWQTFFSH